MNSQFSSNQYAHGLGVRCTLQLYTRSSGLVSSWLPSPAPLPMDHIEKMAIECMKDLNEEEKEEDEGLEEDMDLLVCTFCQWNSVFHGVNSVSNKAHQFFKGKLRHDKTYG